MGGTVLYEQGNRLTREEALRLYTRNNAWFSGETGEKGTIEVGRLGDLVVLSDDYFSVSEEEIKGIESHLTCVGGRVVHAAGDFGDLAPPALPFSPGWSPPGEYGGFHRAASQALRAEQLGRFAGCDCFVI